MLRSMYSGISGMKVNQIKLDVIGNNISNVSTTGYKRSRATFGEMLSQNVSDAMAPANNTGGINAKQVGLGVQLASIDRIMTQGNMQPTNRALDVAIDGDGFFMVSSGPTVFDDSLHVNHSDGNHNLISENTDSNILYTRDGSFTLDKDGNLLTSDGYRVMGYSLTNDYSSIDATGLSPNSVSTAGLDFKFGPGAQLNGYKIVLGEIGPQTVTSAKVNKEEKIITLNGDFSTPGALSTTQIENVLNKELKSEGISQTISVSGKPVTFEGLSSEKVYGGADATSPSAISIGGFTLLLSEGTDLNGYVFEIGKIGTGTPLTVDIDSDRDVKKIVINGDFISRGTVTGNGLKEAINQALKAKGISQQVENISGSSMSISQISGKSDNSGTDLTEINLSYVTKGDTKTDDGTLAGLNFEFEKGGQLNGYTIRFGDVGPDSGAVSANISGKVITIKGNVASNEDSLAEAINKALIANGITSNKVKSVTGKFDIARSENEVLKLDGGSDQKATKSVNLAGITVNLPKGSQFNNISFEIADVKNSEEGGELSIKYDADQKKFSIYGDFTTANKITVADFNREFNKEAIAAGLISQDSSDKIVVTGTPKLYTGLSSSAVEGGLELATPAGVQANGMDFTFGPGGGLNGYTIQIGKMSAGTQTSTQIDSKNKKIIINCDLVNDGATSTQMIENSLNKALQDEGIMQSVKVTGYPVTINGVQTEETYGGTPVESIGEDGVINFVDGTQDLKSYDSELKTLRIPEKVIIPGTGEELRVKTYTIDQNGVINGVLENGSVAALGQIAMASFKNPEGLTSAGGNLYSYSGNSGEAIINSGVGTIDNDNSAGYGLIHQGMLEMSNVDLSEQFTEMITTTRAFQAAGKMITTGDEILQEIINLKR